MNRPLRNTLFTLLLALAPAAQAAEYTLFIYESPEALALRDAPGDAGLAYWNAYAEFAASLAEAGVMRGGAALEPDGQVHADGRRLGGYFVIDVASTELAQQWAARAPANRQGGRVVYVAAIPSPAMPAPAPTASR
jgi:hypothetical protein